MHIREQGILTISHIKILPYILNNVCREEIVNVIYSDRSVLTRLSPKQGLTSNWGPWVSKRCSKNLWSSMLGAYTLTKTICMLHNLTETITKQPYWSETLLLMRMDTLLALASKHEWNYQAVNYLNLWHEFHVKRQRKHFLALFVQNNDWFEWFNPLTFQLGKSKALIIHDGNLV